MRPHVSNLVFEWFHHKESSNIMLSKAWTLYSLKYTYFRTKKTLFFFTAISSFRSFTPRFTLLKHWIPVLSDWLAHFTISSLIRWIGTNSSLWGSCDIIGSNSYTINIQIYALLFFQFICCLLSNMSEQLKVDVNMVFIKHYDCWC